MTKCGSSESTASAVPRVPCSLFVELPRDAAAKMAAFGMIREAFEKVYEIYRHGEEASYLPKAGSRRQAKP
jgi:hypothetical protein